MALTYDIPFYLRWTVDELKDTLPAMLNRDAMLIRISVRFIPCHPRLYHVILDHSYYASLRIKITQITH